MAPMPARTEPRQRDEQATRSQRTKEKRKAAKQEVLVEGEIVDDANGKPLPARLYVRDANGAWHFP